MCETSQDTFVCFEASFCLEDCHSVDFRQLINFRFALKPVLLWNWRAVYYANQANIKLGLGREKQVSHCGLEST